MKIKKILSQHRRDFTAIYECEGCGATKESHGYDDRYFHDHVIPAAKCESCGKSRNDLGIEIEIEIEYTKTKYPEGFQV